jgi:Tol biopolymer transport system component/DNA-binding winged helix-turn-helix (wHTH) protein
MYMNEKLLYRFGPFEMDARERVLMRGGVTVPLTPKSADLLLVLLDSGGRTVTKAELMEKVWPGVYVDEANIAVNVSTLRKALGQLPSGDGYIETLSKRGYRFTAEVTVERDAPEAAAVPEDEPIATRPAKPARRWGWPLAAIVALAGLALAAVAWFARPAADPRVLRYTQLTHDRQLKLMPSGVNPIVTDGPRIYFTENVDNHAVLAQVSAAGGEVTPVAGVAVDSEAADISPDRSSLMLTQTIRTVAANLPLRIQPITGGAARAVSPLNVYDGTWSPDGKRIVYGVGAALMTANADGSEARVLCDPSKLTEAGSGPDQTPKAPALPQWIRWSPDGRLLRFTLSDLVHQSSTLWEVGADGSGLHALLPATDQPTHDCCGNWTPDGRYYIFQSSRGAGSADQLNLWMLRADHGALGAGGARPVQLTAGPLRFHSPVSSLDGKHIFTVGEDTRGELVRYDARGDAFIPYLNGLSATEVEFSRDGNWICYVSYPDGSLWRSRLDGSERLQLTSPPVSARFPHWSPDGKKIAFLSADGHLWRIFAVSANGGQVTRPLKDEKSEGAATWSPDGRTMVFGRVPDGITPSTIELLDTETGGLAEIPGSNGFWAARWSPDGRLISAVDIETGRIMAFDTSSHQWSALGGPHADQTAWSADGQYLYYASWFPGDPAIFRIRVSDRRQERVTSLKNVRRPEHDLPWLGVAPDGSPLLLRDLGSQEIYSLDVDWP